MRFLMVLLIGLAATSPLAAQTPAPETIVVVAPRLQEPLSTRVQSTAVLDADRLTAIVGQPLDEVLKREAGFQLFRRAPSQVANPTTQGATLRSLGGNAAGRALVTLDGVPQDDPFGGWIAWRSFDTGQLARVVVIRGGGAGAFGAGALAGAIALETAALPARTTADADLAIGLRGTFEASANASADLGRARFAARVFSDETEGHQPIERARRGSVDRPLSSRTRVAEMRGAFPFGEATSASLSLRLFDDDRLNGLALAPNATEGFDGSLRLVRDGGEDFWSYEAILYGKNRRFSSGFAAVNAARTTATPSLDQFAVPAHGLGGKIEIRPPLPRDRTLQFGLDWRSARGETRENFRFVNERFTRLREAGGAQRSIGVFTEASARFAERWVLAAGLRLDDWRQYDGARIERDLDSGALTLALPFAAGKGRVYTTRLGASYDLTPAWSARLFAYRGFRLPTLNELYRPFRVGNDVTEANATLKPERLSGLETGLGWCRENGATADVTVFINRIEDAVANVTAARGPGTFPVVGFLPAGGVLRQRDNLERVRVVGLEARTVWPLDERVLLDLSYALTATRIERAPVATLVGKRLAQSPRHNLSAGLEVALTPDFRFTLRGRYTSSQFDDDENERRLKPALVVDAGLAWRFSQRWRASLGVENLFDAKVETARAADGLRSLGPPLQIRAGLAWSLR